LRDPRLFLEDIRESCAKIARYTEGVNFAQFVASPMAYDAVLRNLTIIGEAVKAMPEEIIRRYPSIDWRRIAGLRDILVHAYFGVDDVTIWDIVENKVPELREAVGRVLDDLD
jgi:uncharacterized protein with HEPN domain